MRFNRPTEGIMQFNNPTDRRIDQSYGMPRQSPMPSPDRRRFNPDRFEPDRRRYEPDRMPRPAPMPLPDRMPMPSPERFPGYNTSETARENYISRTDGGYPDRPIRGGENQFGAFDFLDRFEDLLRPGEIPKYDIPISPLRDPNEIDIFPKPILPPRDPNDFDRLTPAYGETSAVDPSDWRTILRILEAGGDPQTETAGIMNAMPPERQMATALNRGAAFNILQGLADKSPEYFHKTLPMIYGDDLWDETPMFNYGGEFYGNPSLSWG
jgi:hypothetical protein